MVDGRIVMALPPLPPLPPPPPPPPIRPPLPADPADAFLARLPELIDEYDLQHVAEPLMASVRPSLVLTATVRYFPEPHRLTAVPTPSDVPDDQRYREVHLAMTPTWSLPNVDSDATPPEKDRDDDWHGSYIDLHTNLEDDPLPHRVLGHPDLLQARLPGDPDHVLLLQVVEDEKAGTGWGAPGYLYFTIQPDDLHHRRWDRVTRHHQAA